MRRDKRIRKDGVDGHWKRRCRIRAVPHSIFILSKGRAKRLNLGSHHFQGTRARSLARMGRRPPKPMVLGSNPSGPAIRSEHRLLDCGFLGTKFYVGCSGSTMTAVPVAEMTMTLRRSDDSMSRPMTAFAPICWACSLIRCMASTLAFSIS